ncbi:MAG: GIY-YIG nuclease family protein [Opitutaceae bacterium]
MDSEYQVYVLRNLTGKYYIGLSEDVLNRLDQHNIGLSKWTAKYRPWTIIWTSDLMSLSDARKLENILKRAKGGNQFYNITKIERS